MASHGMTCWSLPCFQQINPKQIHWLQVMWNVYDKNVRSPLDLFLSEIETVSGRNVKAIEYLENLNSRVEWIREEARKNGCLSQAETKKHHKKGAVCKKFEVGELVLTRKIMVPDPYYIPLVSEIVDTVAEASFLSKLDINKDFYHVRLTEETKLKLAIVTPGNINLQKCPLVWSMPPPLFNVWWILCYKVWLNAAQPMLITYWSTAYFISLVFQIAATGLVIPLFLNDLIVSIWDTKFVFEIQSTNNTTLGIWKVFVTTVLNPLSSLNALQSFIPAVNLKLKHVLSNFTSPTKSIFLFLWS